MALFQINNKSIMQAKVGLIAMLLLTFGPLIGQLTATNNTSEIAISLLTPSSSHHHMMTDSVTMDHGASHHDHSKMHHTWYEQCGYCSLALNFPFLSSSVPNVIPVGFQATTAPIEFVRSAFKSNQLFLLALKRAPPHLIS